MSESGRYEFSIKRQTMFEILVRPMPFSSVELKKCVCLVGRLFRTLRNCFEFHRKLWFIGCLKSDRGEMFKYLRPQNKKKNKTNRITTLTTNRSNEQWPIIQQSFNGFNSRFYHQTRCTTSLSMDLLACKL